MDDIYDVAIVGAGMVGSAAAYHATDISKGKIILIGPDENKNKNDSTIHGCWMDEARIVGPSSSHSAMNKLTEESVKHFKNLETKSGESLMQHCGFLYVGDLSNRNLNNFEESIIHNIKEKFPYLNIENNIAYYEDSQYSGMLNPRKCVYAHQKVAQENGVQILRDIVIKVTKICNSYYELTLSNEKKVLSKKVLACVGGYSAFNDLFSDIKPNMVPDIELRTQSVALLEVPNDKAESLRNMPCICYAVPFEKMEFAYILPPVKYPNNKTYVKIGHGRYFEQVLENLEDVQKWYTTFGNDSCIETLSRCMKHICPDIQFGEIYGDRCVTSHTAGEMPFIDMIETNLAVSFGCNGQGAKMCSEIGRIAIHLLIDNEWKSDLNSQLFKLAWKHKIRQ